MKHIALNCLSDFENDRDFDIKQKNSQKGSHKFLINFFYRKISENGGEHRKFNIISQLKQKRIEADYKQIVITEADSSQVMSKSIEVNDELKKVFKL